MRQEIERFRRCFDAGGLAGADFVPGLAQSHRRGLGESADSTTE
jgi:hypothetical protein